MAGLDFSQSAKPIGQTGLDFSQGATPQMPEKDGFSDTLTGILGQITQGATFGFSDELIGVADAALRSALFDEDFDTVLEATTEKVRQADQAFAEQNPIQAAGLQIGGAALPALATGGIGAAPSLGGAIGRGIGGGIIGGGIFGAGTSEGGLTERALPAATGAVIGGITGGAAAPLLRGAGRGISAIGRRFGRDAPTGTQAGAQRIIREDLASAGLTPERATQQIQALRQQGIPAQLADLGPSLAAEAESIVKQPGAGGAEFARNISQRARLQFGRLSSQLAKATGVKPSQIADSLGEVAAKREQQAAPLYKQAYAFDLEEQAPQLARQFQDLTSSGAGKQAFGKAKRLLETEFRTARVTNKPRPDVQRIEDSFSAKIEQAFRAGRADEAADLIKQRQSAVTSAKFDINKAPLMARVDATKRALDDMIGSAVRRGEAGEARTLTKLKKEMVSAVDKVNPAYKLARDAWAGPTAYLQSVQDGRNILSRTVAPDDLRQSLGSMSASEREGFRVGAVQRILEEFGEKGGAEPDLTRVLDKPNVIAKLKALLPADAGAGLEQAIKEEARLADTARRLVGGSRTEKLAASRDRQEAQAQIFDFITSLKTGNLGTSIIQAMNIPAALKTRFLQGRRDEIARLLATRDPAAALRQRRSPNLGLERVAPAIAGPLGGAAGALTQ